MDDLLETQIRDLVEASPSVTFDEIVLNPVRTRSVRSSMRAVLAAAACIAVAVVSVGAFALFARDGHDAPRRSITPQESIPAPTALSTWPPSITVFGDSVMLGAAEELIATIDPMFATAAVPHVTTVDAAESRRFDAGVDQLQAYEDQGRLGQIVVVQLGTNGTVDPGEFDRMMGILSDREKVVVVNVKVPRPWEQQVNDTLAAGVERYENAVLLDWHGYGGAHPEFFYDDGIHLRPEGADAYARFVAQAVSAAADGR